MNSENQERIEEIRSHYLPLYGGVLFGPDRKGYTKDDLRMIAIRLLQLSAELSSIVDRLSSERAEREREVQGDIDALLWQIGCDGACAYGECICPTYCGRGKPNPATKLPREPHRPSPLAT